MSAGPSSLTLPAELLDGITDVVVSAPDQHARAELIGGLVQEIYASVAWLQAEPHCDELLSLQRLLDETDAHSARLRLLANSQSLQKPAAHGPTSAGST